eukprot:3941230-Rhodomonas_salina.2
MQFLEGCSENCWAVDALHLDNVPSTWLYNVLGAEWVALHERQCGYAAKTRTHTLVGTTSDFISIFGEDISETECGGAKDPSSAVLRVTSSQEGSMNEVTFQWTLLQPGTLLMILCGVALYGPVQPDQTRGDPQWSHASESLALSSKRARHQDTYRSGQATAEGAAEAGAREEQACTAGLGAEADTLTKSLPGPAWSTYSQYLTGTRTAYKVFFLTLGITEPTVVAWVEA